MRLASCVFPPLLQQPQCRLAIGHGQAQTVAQIPFYCPAHLEFQYAVAHGEAAFITSAYLTGGVMDLNMELGVLVRGVALCSDGTVAAWGYNSSGQLGNSSTTSSNIPVAVSTSVTSP